MSFDYLKEILDTSMQNLDYGFFARSDLLLKLSDTDSLPLEYLDERRKRINFLQRETWSEVLELFRTLPDIPDANLEILNGAVKVESRIQINDSDLINIVKHLIPWRKGPWEIGNIQIDAEWNSDLKYSRLRNISSTFKDKSIVDIGGGNGYYAFRALKDNASSVVIFDPSEKFFFQFELFQKYLKLPNIQFEIGGYKEAVLTDLKFDLAFCFGIFYHQKNPVELIDACNNLLKPGGELILETMIWDGDDSNLFFPTDRYAKARNVYFLPTIKALEAILLRSGFTNFDVLDISVTTVEEQRTTEFMPYESLDTFLDPADSSKTVEGYQAPKRAFISVKKK